MKDKKPVRDITPVVFPKDFAIELMDRMYKYDCEDNAINNNKNPSYIVGVIVGIGICCENAFNMTDDELTEVRKHVHDLVVEVIKGDKK